jgi:hypothetical protein
MTTTDFLETVADAERTMKPEICCPNCDSAHVQEKLYVPAFVELRSYFDAENCMLPLDERSCVPCKGAGCGKCSGEGTWGAACETFRELLSGHSAKGSPEVFMCWLLDLCSTCEGSHKMRRYKGRDKYNGMVYEWIPCDCQVGLCKCPTCWDGPRVPTKKVRPPWM